MTSLGAWGFHSAATPRASFELLYRMPHGRPLLRHRHRPAGAARPRAEPPTRRRPAGQVGDFLHEVDRAHDQPRLGVVVQFARVVGHADITGQVELRLVLVGNAHVIGAPGEPAGEVADLHGNLAGNLALDVPLQGVVAARREGRIDQVHLVLLIQDAELDRGGVDQGVGPGELDAVDAFLDREQPLLADHGDVFRVVNRELGSLPRREGNEVHGGPRGSGRDRDHDEHQPAQIGSHIFDSFLPLPLKVYLTAFAAVSWLDDRGPPIVPTKITIGPSLPGPGLHYIPSPWPMPEVGPPVGAETGPPRVRRVKWSESCVEHIPGEMKMSVAVWKDYSLVGAESAPAVQKGLAGAAWYMSPVPKEKMRELLQRRDGPAIRDTLLWFGLLIASGVLGFLLWGTWWAVLPFVVYGVIYGSTSDSRWHESLHGTAFKTDWLNNVLYEIASFMVMRESTLWRWSHMRHHSDTIIVGRDREIAVPRPPQLRTLLLNFVGLGNMPFYFGGVLPPLRQRGQRRGADLHPRSAVRHVVLQGTNLLPDLRRGHRPVALYPQLPAADVHRPAQHLRLLADEHLRLYAARRAGRRRAGPPAQLPHGVHEPRQPLPVLEHELSPGAPHVPTGALL